MFEGSRPLRMAPRNVRWLFIYTTIHKDVPVGYASGTTP